LKANDSTTASSTAPMPEDRPMPTDSRMNKASPELLSEFLKRTAPAIPASEKASASEFWTMMTMPVTISGRMMIVLISD